MVKCVRRSGCMLSVGPLACSVFRANVCLFSSGNSVLVCGVVIRQGNIAFHPEFEQLGQ